MSSAAGTAAATVPSVPSAGGSESFVGPTAGGTPGVGGAVGGSLGGIAGGTSGAGGSAVDPITEVVPSNGCGVAALQTPGMAVRGTLQTMGTKDPDCADSKCGPWSYEREYFVTLPLGYDALRPYTLVFQGPGCGGTGENVYPLRDGVLDSNGNADGSIIRVGLTPPPNDIGHANNPGQSCFDESEGDDSVEWAFYEDLYDRLEGQLCFDKNRVFVAGNGSGGGRFADELACKYAGDASRPIRGVISNSGDWSMNPQYLPTCTTKPTAGMWVHEFGDQIREWGLTKLAIARAMKVDGCTIGAGYDEATLEDFPIGNKPSKTCEKIMGCPAVTPLVVCLLNGNGHGSHDDVVNPGAVAFLKLFMSPPLLTP